MQKKNARTRLSRFFALFSALCFLFTSASPYALAQTTPPPKVDADGNIITKANTGTVIDLGAAGGSYTVPGNLTNNGTIYLISTNPNITTGTLNANNIYNNQGGHITSVIPASGIPGFDVATLVGNFSFILNAVQNIVNAGAITSAANLNLVAGASLTNTSTALLAAVNNISMQAQSIMNTGFIAAQMGNITAATAALNNAGQMQALAGNVNIQNLLGNTLNINNTLGAIYARDNIVMKALGEGCTTLDVTGGVVKANNLVFTGGVINVATEYLEGDVHATGATASIGAAKGDVSIASLNLTGDQLSYSSTGNLILDPTIFNCATSEQDWIFLAGRSILLTCSEEALSSARFGSLTFAAGVDFCAGPAVKCETPSYQINGASCPGGDVSLGRLSLNTQGGPVNIQANYGSEANGDVIVRSIDTSTCIPGASAGNVNILADGAVIACSITARGADGRNASECTPAQAGGNGGNINVISHYDNVNVGNIVSEGGNGGYSRDGSGAKGGNGGTLTVSGKNLNLTNAISAGGNGGGGVKGGNGGNGGAVTLTACKDVNVCNTVGSFGGKGGNGHFGGTDVVCESDVDKCGALTTYKTTYISKPTGGNGGNGGSGGDVKVGAGGNINAGNIVSVGGKGGDAAVCYGELKKTEGFKYDFGCYGWGENTSSKLSFLTGGTGGNGGTGGAVTASAGCDINVGTVKSAGGRGGDGFNGGNGGSANCVNVSAGGQVTACTIESRGGAGGSGAAGHNSYSTRHEEYKWSEGGSYFSSCWEQYCSNPLAGGKGGNGGSAGTVNVWGDQGIQATTVSSAGGKGGNGFKAGDGGYASNVHLNAKNCEIQVCDASSRGGSAGKAAQACVTWTKTVGKTVKTPCYEKTTKCTTTGSYTAKGEKGDNGCSGVVTKGKDCAPELVPVVCYVKPDKCDDPCPPNNPAPLPPKPPLPPPPPPPPPKPPVPPAPPKPPLLPPPSPPKGPPAKPPTFDPFKPITNLPPTDLTKEPPPRLGPPECALPIVLRADAGHAGATEWLIASDGRQPYVFEGDEETLIVATAGSEFRVLDDKTILVKKGEVTLLTGERPIHIATAMGTVIAGPESTINVNQSRFGPVQVATLRGEDVTWNVEHQGQTEQIALGPNFETELAPSDIASTGGADSKQHGPVRGTAMVQNPLTKKAAAVGNYNERLARCEGCRLPRRMKDKLRSYLAKVDATNKTLASGTPPLFPNPRSTSVISTVPPNVVVPKKNNTGTGTPPATNKKPDVFGVATGMPPTDTLPRDQRPKEEQVASTGKLTIEGLFQELHITGKVPTGKIGVPITLKVEKNPADRWILCTTSNSAYTFNTSDESLIIGSPGTVFSVTSDRTIDIHHGQVFVVTGNGQVAVSTMTGKLTVPQKRIIYISQTPFGAAQVSTLQGGDASYLVSFNGNSEQIKLNGNRSYGFAPADLLSSSWRAQELGGKVQELKVTGIKAYTSELASGTAEHSWYAQTLQSCGTFQVSSAMQQQIKKLLASGNSSAFSTTVGSGNGAGSSIATTPYSLSFLPFDAVLHVPSTQIPGDLISSASGSTAGLPVNILVPVDGKFASGNSADWAVSSWSSQIFSLPGHEDAIISTTPGTTLKAVGRDTIALGKGTMFVLTGKTPIAILTEHGTVTVPAGAAIACNQGKRSIDVTAYAGEGGKFEVNSKGKTGSVNIAANTSYTFARSQTASIPTTAAAIPSPLPGLAMTQSKLKDDSKLTQQMATVGSYALPEAMRDRLEQLNATRTGAANFAGTGTANSGGSNGAGSTNVAGGNDAGMGVTLLAATQRVSSGSGLVGRRLTYMPIDETTAAAARTANESTIDQVTLNRVQQELIASATSLQADSVPVNGALSFTPFHQVKKQKPAAGLWKLAQIRTKNGGKPGFDGVHKPGTYLVADLTNNKAALGTEYVDWTPLPNIKPAHAASTIARKPLTGRVGATGTASGVNVESEAAAANLPEPPIQAWTVIKDENYPYVLDADRSTIVTGTPGTIFALSADNELTLKNGTLRVLAGKMQLNVRTAAGNVEVRARSFAEIKQNVFGSVSVAAVKPSAVTLRLATGGAQAIAANQLVTVNDATFAPVGYTVLRTARVIITTLGGGTTIGTSPMTSGAQKALQDNKLAALSKRGAGNNAATLAGAGPEVAAILSKITASAKNADLGGPAQTFTASGAVVRYLQGTEVDFAPAGPIDLKVGEILVEATNPTQIIAADCSIQMARNSVALISNQNGVVKVRNLCETTAHSINVIYNKRMSQLYAGQEAVCGDSVLESMRKDSIARRRIQDFDLETGGRVVTCEYSIVSLCMNNKLIKNIIVAKAQQDEPVVARVLKMSACLTHVTSGHGTYKPLATTVAAR